MRAKKLVAASLALGLAASAVFSPALSALAYGDEVDVSTSTFKADTDASEAFQTWCDTVWATEKADSGKIALTPGETENDLNFAWYSETTGTPAVKIWKKGQSKKAKIVKGSATAINQKNWQGNVYTASNKVSIENYFKANTTYEYQYTDNYNGKDTEWSETETYKTSSFSSFTAILTGDPQIGASGSSDDKTDSDSSAARDTYNWNLTMESAIETAPNAAFLLSAGDQIDKSSSGSTDTTNNTTRESEYAGYLYPEVFRSLPIASTIGNHDTGNADYTYHFNNPNSEDNLGSTAAGSDYYFSYGDVLFISLNSNNRNQEEHRELMQEAVASHKDAAWKVVIFHSDIYGSGEPHADTDATSNRIILAPLMDEFDIDVCLTGHDHTYSRSYQILNGNVVDYDISNGSVKNPEGTLYITTGSGSGSKYYNLLNYTPYYIADRTNVCLPAYSTLKFTKNSFTICTYDYNGDLYAESFTIKKTGKTVSAVSLLAKADAIDTSRYTEASVQTVKNAADTLRELVYTEDEFAAFASENYGTDADPFSGYGSVTAKYKDKSTGKAANRLAKGNSTLIDKTIYTQNFSDETSEEELPIVSAATYANAKQKLSKAIANLKTVKQTKPSKPGKK